MAARCVVLAAMAGAAAAVTSNSNTPTADSNYMVLQGPIEYFEGAGLESSFGLGAISGAAQIDRSALRPETRIRFALQTETGLNGVQVSAVLNRRPCVDFSANNPHLPYQDPYQCPNYVNFISGATNDCQVNSQGVVVAGSTGTTPVEPYEARFSCTLDGDGACATTFDWQIYVPDDYAGQSVSDFSIAFAVGANAFACADMTQSRERDNQNKDPASAQGDWVAKLYKDELGYTHLITSATQTAPNTGYTLELGSGACGAVFPENPSPFFTAQDSDNGLAQTVTSDGSGTIDEQDTFVPVTLGPDTASLRVSLTASGAPHVCFDLEVVVGPDGRTGADRVGSDSDSETDACSVWYHALEGREEKSNKGKHKKQKKATKGKDKDTGALERFETVNLGGGIGERCCLKPSAVDGATGSAAQMIGGMPGSTRAEGGSLFAGIGAGLAGAIILAAGIVLHIRRVRAASAEGDYIDDDSHTATVDTTGSAMPSECTPLAARHDAGADE